jgi:S1-C subfamily serine protease
MRRIAIILGAILSGSLLFILGGLGAFLLVTSAGERAPTGASLVVTPGAVAPSPVLAPEIRDLLAAEEAWLKQLYATASPSVVNITSRSYSHDFFFRVVPQEGTSSGFVWDQSGHIVTNHHVIRGAQEIEVRLADGSQYSATIVGTDPANDLAVIRAAGSTGSGDERPLLPEPLPLGDSSAAEVGQRVVAIGNPFGYERTLTSGVVSALGRVIQSESGDFIGEVIQHDAAINPGNSGGPLLDIDGRVIGVNTQIVSTTGASAGIGFAIPAGTVARVIPELIARGRYPHPWLGVEAIDMTPGLAARLRQGGLPVDADAGVLVVGIYRGGPAEGVLRGGRQAIQVGNLVLPVGGDLLVELDGQPVPDQRAMYLYLENHKRVGESVQTRFWRDGVLQEATLTLVERPG